MSIHNKILTIPNDFEAEQAVLGALISDNEHYIEIAGILDSNSFHTEKHRHIYRAYIEITENGDPVDEIILGDQLKAMGKLKEIGGYSYLAELVECVPVAGNIEYYAKIIQEHALVRDLIVTTADIGRKSRNPNQNIAVLLAEAESKIVEIATRFTNKKFVHIKDVLVQAYSESEKLSKKEDGLIGFSTGYHDLDKLTSGLIPGNLYVIAGRPAMGKTSFALNIIINKHKICNTGDTLLFLREGSNIQAARRMLSAEAKLNNYDIKLGKLSQESWDKLSKATKIISQFSIFLDDQTEDIDQICHCIKVHARKRKVELVVTDYLQLIESSKNENREQKVADMTRKMKNLAGNLDVPVILLSQLSRAVENRSEKIPQLSDLRESGSIEQDADIVIFIYRDEIYNENTTKKGIANIILAKQRDGPTGVFELIFEKEFTLFKNIEKYGVPGITY